MEKMTIQQAVGAGALLFIAVVLFSCLRSSTSSGRKTMKAPGRDYRIFRADFESDPGSYFRNLRK